MACTTCLPPAQPVPPAHLKVANIPWTPLMLALHFDRIAGSLIVFTGCDGRCRDCHTVLYVPLVCGGDLVVQLPSFPRRRS